MHLNVLPRPGPAQPPPQIIGRPSDVERLLDEAGQRAQECTAFVSRLTRCRCPSSPACACLASC